DHGGGLCRPGRLLQLRYLNLCRLSLPHAPLNPESKQTRLRHPVDALTHPPSSSSASASSNCLPPDSIFHACIWHRSWLSLCFHKPFAGWNVSHLPLTAVSTRRSPRFFPPRGAHLPPLTLPSKLPRQPTELARALTPPIHHGH